MTRVRPTHACARLRWIGALLVGLSLALPAPAEVQLPRPFGNDMVLQRDKPVPVWGRAKPDESVTVRFDKQEKTVKAGADGKWMVKLDPMPASSEPRELKVSGSNTVTCRNVLVGDVWLCSGDFGVFYEVFACLDAEKEIAGADNPLIRLIKVPFRSSNEPLEDFEADWRVCTPTVVRGSSGLAYFFARALQRELKVPVGAIDASYRYSTTRSFISPQAYRTIPELSKPREKMESWDPTTETGQKAFSATVAAVEKWLPVAKQAFTEGKPIPPQPRVPAPLPIDDSCYRSLGELCNIYHGMIEPLIPFAIRGAVWSQGESGCMEPGKFRFYVQGLIQGWRQAWGQGDIPFCIELLPQMGKPAEAPLPIDSWTLMRMEQLQCRSVPRTAVVATFDVSDYVAETRNRQDPGERTALAALALEYGKNVVASGPVYKSHRVEGDRVIITYDSVGRGLMVGKKDGLAPVAEVKDGALKGFAIAGADKKWVWATAKIEGETVVLRSDAVAAPVAVRYAVAANPSAANLYNRDGLPAVPFRTDDW
jgi:sialate O-acetylesterase